MFRTTTLTFLLASFGFVAGFEDCDPAKDLVQGPFKPVFFEEVYNETTFYSLIPEAGEVKLPLFAFMHGSTGQYEFYRENLELLSSQGGIVVFPFVKSPEKDKSPFTTNTDGKFIIKAIQYAKEMNEDPESPYFGKVDVDHIVIGGHSMGATCSINSSNQLKDDESIKLTIAMHPGICGPFGPPPCPACWRSEDLQAVASSHPVIFTTAKNDGAFWPAPLTSKFEYGCFEKAVGTTDEPDENIFPIVFSSYDEDVCAEDGEREPTVKDGGHNCPMKNAGAEFELAIAAFKLYAQLGGDANTKCYNMIYGSSDESLSMANTTDVLDIRA